MALLSTTHHDDDTVKYSDDNCSTDSYLNYCQQEGNTHKRVNSYNFLHNTDTFTSTDIPNKIDDTYFSYLDKNYNKFDNGFSLTHMQKLTNKDIANHIKEIDNDVTHVNFDKIYSYQHTQMVAHQFEKIFQRKLNADPSSTLPLSCYIDLDLYIDHYCPNSDAFCNYVESVTITSDPHVDMLTLRKTIGDHIVF